MKALNRKHILVVEDDALIAYDLVECLKELGLHPIGPAYDVEMAKAFIQDEEVHIALLDIHLDQAEDGIDLAVWIRENHQMPIVFLTGYCDSLTLSNVRHVFPDQFLVKPFNKSQLKASLAVALHNYYHPNPRFDNHGRVMLLNQSLDQALSPREMEILLLLCDGLSNQQIANTLFVSPNTVKTHLKNIFMKTNSSSRAELVSKLMQY